MPPRDSSGTPPSEPSSDLALVRRVGQGDPEAMRALYARCAGRAYGLVLRILRVRADADEVLQETFLELWRRARDFDPALQALPPEQRSVVELAYFEGLSQSEIAERTGTPLGTVKTRARLALTKLAQLLEGS
jgi:DNA-directed RNA polymerase specialized sigma24 family protein